MTIERLSPSFDHFENYKAPPGISFRVALLIQRHTLAQEVNAPSSSVVRLFCRVDSQRSR